MQIQFVKSGFLNREKIDSVIDPFVKKIDPESKIITLPSWLTPEDGVWIYEKERKIMIVSLWQDRGIVDNITRLLRIKSRWSQFINSMDPSYQAVLTVIGEKIPSGALKLFSLEPGVRAFELIASDTLDSLFVREVTLDSLNVPAAGSGVYRRQDESSSREKPRESVMQEMPINSGESFLKQDTQLSSFFYKMGKLSEEELARFLDMESDLDRLG